MTGPDVVFLGPTLRADEARAAHPDVVVLAPAAMGDVASVARRLRPHAIGLIDGVFRSSLSVFHKELLYAVDLGTWVLGASSMGALRAAECRGLGVLGVGQVYDAYVRGDLEDDDEVALVHAPAEGGFRARSDAMVTVRAAVATLERAALVDGEEAAALVALQKARWFPERSVAGLADDAEAIGVVGARLDALRARLAAPLADPKRDDALELLARLRALPAGAVPARERPGCVLSPPFRALLARELALPAEGVDLRADDVRRHAALHDPGYLDDLGDARAKVALCALSEQLGGPLTDDELAEGERRVVVGLATTSAGLAEAASAVDLDDEGLRALVEREAHVARVAAGDLGTLAHGAVTAPYLDQLRLAGRYLAARDRAALELRLAAEAALPEDATPAQVLATLAALTGSRSLSDLEGLARDTELGSASEVLDAAALTVRAGIALFGAGLAAPDSEAEPREEPASGPRGR